MSVEANARPADARLRTDVEHFLYEEAAALDERRYEEWLSLFALDCRYAVRTRSTLAYGPNSAAIETTMLCEDDREFLALRVARLQRQLGSCERPPSLTRRFVSNLRVYDVGATLEAHSNIAVYQGRVADNWFVGERVDRLSVKDGTFSILDRCVTLDCSIVPRTLTVLL